MDATVETMADLLHRLGDIAADRILMKPLPGTATVADLIALEAKKVRLCELVDGVLVEKAIGLKESILAMALGEYLRVFARSRKLGIVLGPDGTLEMLNGLVRLPDVAFISRERLPDGKLPSEPVPHLVPDLAVEVISQSNTKAEMARKRQEYFSAGVRAVWEIDHVRRCALVYSAPETCSVLTEEHSLDGAPVLPGFTVELKALFSELD